MQQIIRTESGRISLTKFWSFIGCMVATWIIIYTTLNGEITWEMFVAYLGSVCGFSQISKWLSYRYGAKSDGVSSTVCERSIEIKKCADCSSVRKV